MTLEASALAIHAAHCHDAMIASERSTVGYARNRNRALLTLHRDHGLDYQRVAELTGIPLSVIRNAIDRTIKKGVDA